MYATPHEPTHCNLPIGKDAAQLLKMSRTSPKIKFSGKTHHYYYVTWRSFIACISCLAKWLARASVSAST